MKKTLLILLLLLFIPSVAAIEINEVDVPTKTYIVGTYMFTRNLNEATGYNGVLTTKRMLFAARTMTGTTESEMIIYYKRANGTWMDGITGELLPDFDSSVDNYEPHVFNISVIDLEEASASMSKVRVYYHINGGTINSSTYAVDSNGWITKDNEWVTHTVSTDATVNLYDVSEFGITKIGNSPTPGIEWCTGKNGNGVCYNQNEIITYSSLRNGSTEKVGFYELDLYVNWTPDKYTLNYNDNLFTGRSGTQNGVTKTVDVENGYLTLNGTWTETWLSLWDYESREISTTDQYQITLTYVSGSYTSSVSPSFVVELLKDGQKYSDRTTTPYAYVVKAFPTSGSTSSTYDVARSGANGLSYWLWQAEANATTFNNYKVRVEITKVHSDLVTYDSTYGSLDTPTKSGYHFDGWYTSLTGGTQVTSSTVVKTGTDHTLYAHWTPYTMTIKFNVNGGTIATGTGTERWRVNNNIVQRSIDSGSTWADAYNEITAEDAYLNIWNVSTYGATKSGYKVTASKQYNTLADGTGNNINQDNFSATDNNPVTVERLNGGSQLTEDKVVTIYINWDSNKPIYVYYHPNGGNVGASGYTTYKEWLSTNGTSYFYFEVSENQTSDLHDVNTFGITKSGYIPKPGEEWRNESGYTFNQATNYSYATLKEHVSGEYPDYYFINLWANWSPQQLIIVYHKNDGTNVTSSETFTYDGNMNDDIFNPPSSYNIRAGYKFAGWSLKEDGSDNIRWAFNDGIGHNWFLTQLGTSPSVTLDVYAQWTAKPVYIYYHPNEGTVNSATYTTYNNWLSTDGTSYFYQIVNGGQTTDLYNVSTFGIVMSGNIPKSGNEWCNENKKYCFDQDDNYSYAQFVEQASGEYPNYYYVNLWVNWEPQFIKLGTIEFREERLKVPNYDNSVIIGQGFTIASDYYVAAKISSDDTKADISIYNRKTLAKINSFRLTGIGHANDLAYNPNTGEIYTVLNRDNYSRSFKLSEALNGTPSLNVNSIYYNNNPLEFHGIDYDTSNNKYYAANGSYVYIYNDFNELDRRFKKIDMDTPQGIGAYDGKVLVIRYNNNSPAGNGNVDTTKNAVDIYRASNGDYLGSYEINSEKELESLAYNPDTGKFAFYFIDDYYEYGYIYEAAMAIPE